MGVVASFTAVMAGVQLAAKQERQMESLVLTLINVAELYKVHARSYVRRVKTSPSKQVYPLYLHPCVLCTYSLYILLWHVCNRYMNDMRTRPGGHRTLLVGIQWSLPSIFADKLHPISSCTTRASRMCHSRVQYLAIHRHPFTLFKYLSIRSSHAAAASPYAM